MNSQQELIEAINTISEDKNKAYDTPATVLRVEGDTVWVHIDGGADETPVQKTINAEEGETVQVRISNGSAFLVGNASAPPTDDTTANEAHFVAEQADEKATEAIESVDAISQTVQGKVDSGDSNITNLSSTMYQNASGVNIFNDELDVGDSYAHIDGDSFDIKQVTTEGEIDDDNDVTLASFGADEITIGKLDEEEGGFLLKLTSSGVQLVQETPPPIYTSRGWSISSNAITWGGIGVILAEFIQIAPGNILLRSPGGTQDNSSKIGNGTAEFEHHHIERYERHKTSIDGGHVTVENLMPSLYIRRKVDIDPGTIHISGAGNNPSPYAIYVETDDLVSENPYNSFCVNYAGDVYIKGEVRDMNGNVKYGSGGTSVTVSGENLIFSSGAYVSGENLVIS